LTTDRAPDTETRPAASGKPGAAGACGRLRVLIDDVRRFRDGRTCLVARSSSDGVALLRDLTSRRIDELCLDHDLVGDDTIWPVVRLLDDASLAGRPFDVGTVHVHASRSGPAHNMLVSLRRAGYTVNRPSDPRVFTW
jgi:hypothetical protein